MKLTLALAFGIVFLAFIGFVSANSDILSWQGQYYTGTHLNEGTYNFNFTVYDSPTGGTACYTNTTSLTTNFLGAWITNQYGVNSACTNSSKNYYLNIKIDGVDQSPRRLLNVFNFLRKNVDDVTTGDLSIYGVLGGHSPLRVMDSIQYVSKITDTPLFSVYTAGNNVVGDNVSSNFNGVIIHQIENHTNPAGLEECWWDRQSQNMRLCLSNNSIEMYNKLDIDKGLNVDGNLTAQSYFGDGSHLTGISTSSNQFNQVLNTTSNVQFNSIKTPLLKGEESGGQSASVQLKSNAETEINSGDGKPIILNANGPLEMNYDDGSGSIYGSAGQVTINGDNGLVVNGDLFANNANFSMVLLNKLTMKDGTHYQYSGYDTGTGTWYINQSGVNGALDLMRSSQNVVITTGKNDSVGAFWLDMNNGRPIKLNTIKKGDVEVGGNLTVASLLKVNIITLPNCVQAINGTIGRNTTKLYFCDGITWNGLY